MDIKIEGFVETNANYMRTALNLRYEIFTEEFKIDKYYEFDGLDKDATHYLMFVDMLPVGVARWRKVNNELFIDRFGIHTNYRNKGFAFLFLKYIINELLPSKLPIYLLGFPGNKNFHDFVGFTEIVEEMEQGGITFIKLKYHYKETYG
jgi:predicted GNAT family N-acyltransferase